MKSLLAKWVAELLSLDFLYPRPQMHIFVMQGGYTGDADRFSKCLCNTVMPRIAPMVRGPAYMTHCSTCSTYYFILTSYAIDFTLVLPTL